MGSETEMRQQPEDATVKDDKSPLPSAAVEGIEGNKRSRLVSVRAIVTSSHPYHVTGQPYHWTRSTALSFAAELDGHVLGTCAQSPWRCSLTGLSYVSKGFSVQANPVNGLPSWN